MEVLSCKFLLSDSGIFVNKDKTIVAIIYVDDMLLLGANKKKLHIEEQFMKALRRDKKVLVSMLASAVKSVAQSRGSWVLGPSRLIVGP